MKDTIIVGIAGASASGKSLLATTIANEINSSQVAIISEDSYYKDCQHLTLEQRSKINYDHPDSLDHNLLCEHLSSLIQGKTIKIPIYNYTTHSRTTKTKTINKRKIIILEGILLFVVPKLRDLMDIRIYMDTPLDVCLIRRLKRDTEERGRTLHSILEQYQNTVRPMYLQFIEPSKHHADIIVPRGGANRIAIDIIKARMRESLSS